DVGDAVAVVDPGHGAGPGGGGDLEEVSGVEEVEGVVEDDQRTGAGCIADLSDGDAVGGHEQDLLPVGRHLAQEVHGVVEDDGVTDIAGRGGGDGARLRGGAVGVPE